MAAHDCRGSEEARTQGTAMAASLRGHRARCDRRLAAARDAYVGDPHGGAAADEGRPASACSADAAARARDDVV